MLALLKVLEFSISCGTFSPPRSYDKSIIPLSIYPHISYVIVAWGSAYKTHVNKLLTSKTKSFCKSRFFKVLYGENTLSTLPLLNLPDFLTINIVYQFNALKFIHDWHKQSLPSIFNNSFHYAKMSTHTIRGMLPKTISTSLDLEPTWESRQLVIWQQISGKIFPSSSKN